MNLNSDESRNSGLVEVSKFALSLLSKQEKRKYLKLTLMQIISNCLEIIALFLVVVLITIVNKNTSNYEQSGIVSGVLSLTGLKNEENDKILFLMSLITISIFLFKTFLSITLTKRTLNYLSKISTRLSTETLKDSISNYGKHSMTLSMGEVIYALSSGVRKIIYLILGSIFLLISDLALLVILIIGLVVFNPQITVASILVFGFAFFLSHYLIARKTYELGKIVTENDIHANNQVLNILRNRKEIFVKGNSEILLEVYHSKRKQHLTADGELIFLQNSSRYLLDIVVPMSAFILISLQTFFPKNNENSLSIVVFLVAGTRIAPALIKIQSNLIVMKSVAGEVENVTATIKKLRYERQFVNNLDIGESMAIEGASLIFNQVSFQYSIEDEFHLKEVTFQVHPGEIVAIVGPSGTGKSTIIDLALGLLTPKSGRVLLGGVKPQDIVVKNPGRIGYVTQEPMIIGGSIRDNILFGSPTLTGSDEEIWRALLISGLREFVSTLQNGIDTQIGEFGVSLSGGQKQRLGIARALISDPAFLILDEVTSALDYESEDAIKKMLGEFKGKKSILMVSHSKNLVEIADKIVFIENGSVSKVSTSPYNF